MAQFLYLFIEKWGVYPPPVKLLSSPLWQMKRDATMTGRWGVIPVYPWTTEKEVKQQARQIQRAIGKKHQDFTSYRQALKAKWLEDSHISEAANRPPGRNKIAAEVWGRKEGLKRWPFSKEVGIANLSIRWASRLNEALHGWRQIHDKRRPSLSTDVLEGANRRRQPRREWLCVVCKTENVIQRL